MANAFVRLSLAAVEMGKSRIDAPVIPVKLAQYHGCESCTEWATLRITFDLRNKINMTVCVAVVDSIVLE
eukprot:12279682-Ditylum_brightwellii.AAC.1